MTSKDITPEDSACPVFIEPIDPAQAKADEAERKSRAEAKQAKTDARAALLERLNITSDEAALLLS